MFPSWFPAFSTVLSLLCHHCNSCYKMMSRLQTTISTVVHVEAVCASKILPIGIFITLSLRSKILLYVSIPTLPAHYAENERFLSFPSSPLSGYSLDDQKGHGCGRDLRTRSIFSLPRLVRWINV